MTTWDVLTSAWDWEPSVVIGCAALLVGYAVAVRFRFTGRAVYFVLGVLLLLLALVSPVDVLGDDYLFSAHMLQHLLLILVIPPLLLLGIPPELAERAFRVRLVSQAERVLGRPPVAWSVAIVNLWVWHWPALYDETLAHEGLHVAEHLIFLITFVVFWWPLLAPLERYRMPPMGAFFYIFAAAVANTVLGVIITFAPPGLYPAYLHPPDELGILPLIRERWGLTTAADQQLGGLLMWVLGMFVFAATLVSVVLRWYRSAGPVETATPVVRRLEQ